MNDKESILIVDDNINLAKTMSLILKRKGSTVATAKDGIEALEILSKLEIPFQQVDMSSTKEHEGTGLGLYLCKKLLDLLHGKISVISQFGKGSEFKFIIPIEFKEEV